MESRKEWVAKWFTVGKRNKSKQGPRTFVAKLLNYKDKEYILKNTHHLKDTNIYVNEIFQKKQWQYVSHYSTRLRNYDSKKNMLWLIWQDYSCESVQGDK